MMLLKKQIDTLPQLACQYLHEEKIRLAAKISQDIEKKFGVKGRVHFNVGGAQAIEDAIKVVRNHTGKIPDVCVYGRVSRPHVGGNGHYFQLPLPGALRPFFRPG